MKKVFALLALLLAAPLNAAQYKEGVQYEVLAHVQPTADEEKIEVLELFWYGCPHCYYLEPEIRAWLENKPDDVSFVRIPAVLGPSWELLARAYYTADLLDALDNIHEPLFRSIHKDKKRFRDADDVRAFFVEHGVDGKDFDNTFSSFAVITKTNRARQAREMYGIKGVPTLVVNGKYRTTATLAGGNAQMLQVIDFLVGQERSAAAEESSAAAQN